MNDVIYCPRCSVAVVLEGNEDTHGYCMNCRFDFCTLCKDPFHVVFNYFLSENFIIYQNGSKDLNELNFWFKG